MDVLEFTVFSWALEIKMLECQSIRAQNAAFSRVKGFNMLEFTAFSWVLELIILELKALSRIEGLKMLVFTAFSWVVVHTARPWRIFCTSGPSHWTPPMGTRVKQARFGKSAFLQQNGAFLGYVFCEEVWSTFVRTMVCWHVWFCEAFFVKLQYEQNLDDDNDKRGHMEALWGWRLNTKGQAESHVAWILNFKRWCSDGEIWDSLQRTALWHCNTFGLSHVMPWQVDPEHSAFLRFSAQ